MKLPVLAVTLLVPLVCGGEELNVHISTGHRAAPFDVKLTPAGGVEVRNPGGAGKTGSRTFTLAYPAQDVKTIQNLQIIWADLIAHSDPDTVRRLTGDPAWRIDPRRITVETRPGRGFTLTIDQLLRNRNFWIPSLDVYVSAGSPPVPFADHQRELERWRGRRILDQVQAAPEASYEQYKSLWEDMGSPNYTHPSQPAPGHIVCLSWDGAVAKFGVDRGAGVWNDLGNPDKFRFWFDFGDLFQGIGPYWKSQSLAGGLPVVTTVFERSGTRYEVEQFAYPLNGPPAGRPGGIKMLLLARVKLTDLTGHARAVPVTMSHERKFAREADAEFVAEQQGARTLFVDHGLRNTLLAIDAPGAGVAWSGVGEHGAPMKRLDVTLTLDLPARGTREFTVTLPSQPVAPAERPALAALDHTAARAATLKFWSDYSARGAQFQVPEEAVNDLFRASLWHALRLPRRHDDGRIDLPYSNFAYGQEGTPWPVNQAVYVDYMLYGLRAYNGIAAEEFEAIYRNNQEVSGHVNGYANWLVYTPGMLYSIGQNYLLSGDRDNFERLLPATLKALDWSLEQIRKAQGGLVEGPLNDATGRGTWGFNQAYLYAGLDVFGKALERAGHPRAQECLDAAHAFREAVERGFREATVRSPLVQLRDHTWIPYVPCEANRHGRILDDWYPTDVDTGSLHMVRLKALAAEGDLAESLLNDHEDNLFLNGWGIANEPVYNQQATAYLQRDDVKAVIRAFYSYMASAFSHSTLEPVEHRWRWGQYFGPPSTDGAWFELYRNMLVRELDDNTLLLAQATPRAWLEDGKKIAVTKAPTWFGAVSYTIESKAGSLTATIELEKRVAPQAVLLRLRHPQGKRLRQVTVNGKDWRDFDPGKEWVKLPAGDRYTVIASY